MFIIIQMVKWWIRLDVRPKKTKKHLMLFLWLPLRAAEASTNCLKIWPVEEATQLQWSRGKKRKAWAVTEGRGGRQEWCSRQEMGPHPSSPGSLTGV